METIEYKMENIICGNTTCVLYYRQNIFTLYVVTHWQQTIGETNVYYQTQNF